MNAILQELYVDNFRSLVDFRLRFTPFQLWAGANGSGKTSVLDVVLGLNRVMCGDDVDMVFQRDSLTVWGHRRKQRFGLTLEIDGEPYDYRLEVEHTDSPYSCQVVAEELRWKGDFFYKVSDGDVHLYRINRNTQVVEHGTQFAALKRRSFLSVIEERPDNTPVIKFRDTLARMLVVSPNPLVMEHAADHEDLHLKRHAENFASWYRHIVQEHAGVVVAAREMLTNVLSGFDALSLKTDGGIRRLFATFRINGSRYDFSFQSLSDGQRQAIVLYTLLALFRERRYPILAFDEPDNFLTLREIDPWWQTLNDACDEEVGQVIVISHHPTVVNNMGHDKAIWFSRPEGKATVVKPYPLTDGPTPAEAMERGWCDEC